MATATLIHTENNTMNDYHTVIICGDLPEVEKYYSVERAKECPSADFWLNKMDEKFDKTHLDVRYIMSNGSHTSTENHPIFSAFLFAYNSHEDIVLSPDDIWLLICIYFSQYVNEHAEQLRALFVDHDGRKTLTIEQVGLLDPNWIDFLRRMQIEICKNVKNDVADLLVANFSTTGMIESFLSCVTMMSTFQKYFEYRCLITRCGIRNVHFKGTLDDWNNLRQKTEELRKLTVSEHDEFGSYIDGLLPIIDQFIQTYQGNVDEEFWNKIMDIEHVGMGRSGKMPGTYINGWFLKLCYGLHMKKTCEIKQIKLNCVNVPVQVDNEMTNESKTCYIIGGFHGVESCDGRHKPVMSLAIMDDTSTIRPYKQK